ncbi:MAG: hypothetical protein HGA83_08205 [Bacteroidales bacterium]|nr:hypothetical protein [Bacteroidales bacterium]
MFDIYEYIYQTRKDSPLWWHNKSSDLHASAGVLWLAISEGKNESFQEKLGFGNGFSFEVACWPVYQMTFGISFELALKSVIVAKKEIPPHSHDLVKLSEMSGIEFNEYELAIFKLLTELVVWDGKYPVPKKQEFLKAHYLHKADTLWDDVQFGELKLNKSNDSLDWDELHAIYNKITDVFFKHYKSI